MNGDYMYFRMTYKEAKRFFIDNSIEIDFSGGIYYLDEEFISLEEAFKNFLETSEDFNLIKHLNDDDEILQVYEADNEPIYFPLNKDYEYLLNGINGDEGNLNLNYDDAINEKKLVAGDGFEPPTFGL